MDMWSLYLLEEKHFVRIETPGRGFEVASPQILRGEGLPRFFSSPDPTHVGASGTGFALFSSIETKLLLAHIYYYLLIILDPSHLCCWCSPMRHLKQRTAINNSKNTTETQASLSRTLNKS
jgi:hypothetical protein